MLPKVIVDTDTLSLVMRGELSVDARERVYRVDHPRLTISAITRYEIERGLHAKRALVQLQAFGQRCAAMEILPIDDGVLDRAARIWASLRTSGVQIQDADCLIAATAIVHDRPLVTNNTRHFAGIVGLELENWLT